MEFIGSLLFGKLADLLGKRIVYYIMFIVHSLAIGMTFIMTFAQPYLFYVTTAIAGLADSALNTELYALLGTLFKHSASEAFGCKYYILNVFTLLNRFQNGSKFIYINWINCRCILESLGNAMVDDCHVNLCISVILCIRLFYCKS